MNQNCFLLQYTLLVVEAGLRIHSHSHRSLLPGGPETKINALVHFLVLSPIAAAAHFLYFTHIMLEDENPVGGSPNHCPVGRNYARVFQQSCGCLNVVGVGVVGVGVVWWYFGTAIGCATNVVFPGSITNTVQLFVYL